MAFAALTNASPVRAAATANPPAAAIPSSMPGAAILLPALQPPPGQMGYYMMQGSRIVSQSYASGPACLKALGVLMKSLPATVAPIVCAHRAP
jgi:hypothetical protein